MRNRDKLRQFPQHLSNISINYELEQGIDFMQTGQSLRPASNAKSIAFR